jgi:hypothetical protein
MVSSVQVNWAALLSAYQKEGLHDAKQKLAVYLKSKGLAMGGIDDVNEVMESLRDREETIASAPT